MTLEEYDQRVAEYCQVEREAQRLQRQVSNLEHQLYIDAGIACVNREPGFPCWSHNDLPGYYNTPRQVMEALEKEKWL